MASSNLPQSAVKAWTGKSFPALQSRVFLFNQSGKVPKTTAPIVRKITRTKDYLGRVKESEGVADSLQLHAAGIACRLDRHAKCCKQAAAAKAKRDAERAARRQA